MIMYADGFKYWLAYKKNNTSYFRCSRYKNQCSGRCVVEDGKIRTKTPHNHVAEPDRALVDNFRKILTQRAATEKTELYAIYSEEATQRHSEAALLYVFSQAESAMRKARRKQLPRAPNTIKELGDILAISDLFHIHTGTNRDPFYQSSIILEDSTCVIFMHRKTLELIGRVDEMHVDASFHIIPINPPSYYLFTAHAIQQFQNVPIFFAIVTNKNQKTFASLFAHLREQLSNYIMPNIILSEFDIGMQTALSYTFPEATVKVSWFHYTEAVVKQMKYLGLHRETTKGHGASALRMLMVLPLLPAEYMNPGLIALKKWMTEKGVFSQGISTLCDYVEQCWLRKIGVDKMSIFGLTNGINNHLQTFNKDLRHSIGITNPTIWHMLECLTTIATKNYVKISKKIRANTPMKQPRKGRIVVDTIINNATELWIRTAVHLRNPLQFLQLSSHCIQDINNFSGIDDGKLNNNNSNNNNNNYYKNLTTSTTSAPSSTSSSYSLMHVVQQSQQQQNIHQHQQINQQQQNQQQYSMITLNNNTANNCNNLFNSSITTNSIGTTTDQYGNTITVLPIQQYQQQQPQQQQIFNNNLSIDNYNHNNNVQNHHSNNIINNQYFQLQQQQQPQRSDPPPLVFFPKVKKLVTNRSINLEPPPLVPISKKFI